MPSNSYQSSDDVTWWSEQLVHPDLLNNVLQPQFPAGTQNYPQRPQLLPPRLSQVQPPYHNSTYPSNTPMNRTGPSSPLPPLQTVSIPQRTSQHYDTSSLAPQGVSRYDRSVPRSSISPSNSASSNAESNSTSPQLGPWLYWTPTGVVQEGPAHDDSRRFPCQGCSQTFVNPSDRARHWKYACEGNDDRITFSCPHCGQNFTRQDAMNKHVKLVCGRVLPR